MAGSPTPPLPPRIPGRIRMPLPRLAGTLTIILIPVLAAWGVFGKTIDEQSVESAAFHADLRHPSRLNYQEQAEILVRVKNRAPAPITAVVSFDAELIEGFSDVTFSPSEEKAYAIRLPSIAPGEKATARVSLRGDGYGSHTGRIQIAGGGVTADVNVSVFVFP